MNRRDFIAGLGALVLSPVAFSTELMNKQESQQGGDVKPYKEVKLNYEDKNRVLLAVSFTCPHCKDYDHIMAGWSKTLPSAYLKYDRLPIVVDQESVMAATAYYAFSRTVGDDHEAKNEFVSRAFALIQTHGMSPMDPETWRSAASGVHLPVKSVKDDVVKAAEKVISYNIERTPTMIFGGRYVATPNDSGGREDLFVQLANGLASMTLNDIGYRAK
jgi:thiol:disulfide interchange protein DsbA